MCVELWRLGVIWCLFFPALDFSRVSGPDPQMGHGCFSRLQTPWINRAGEISLCLLETPWEVVFSYSANMVNNSGPKRRGEFWMSTVPRITGKVPILPNKELAKKCNLQVNFGKGCVFIFTACTYGSRLCVYIVICDKFTKPGGGTCTISPSSPGLLSGTCSASCSAPGTTAQASFSSMLSIARSCSHRCEVRIRCCLTGSKSKFQPEWPAISECYQHRLISCGK